MPSCDLVALGVLLACWDNEEPGVFATNFSVTELHLEKKAMNVFVFFLLFARQILGFIVHPNLWVYILIYKMIDFVSTYT